MSARDHQSAEPISEPVFFILLGLTVGYKHGYAILKDVERLSQAAVLLSTSTLYTELRRLEEQGCVERMSAGGAPAPALLRKVYALTQEGRALLQALARRYQVGDPVCGAGRGERGTNPNLYSPIKRSLPMNLQPGAHLPGGPIHIWQLAAIFLPFLLLFLFPLGIWADMGPALCLPFLGLLFLIWIAGLSREFPVWTLPALGMVLFLVSAFLKGYAMMVVFTAVSLPLYGEWGWPSGDLPLVEKIGMMLLVQLVFLVIVAGVVAGLLRAVPRIHARVRQEWTLLSFLLYSIAIVPTWLWGEEFHGVEGYHIASLLILAVGAGLYLVAPRRWQRALALVVPAVLAPVVMSVGLYQAFPAQSWANPANPPFSPQGLASTFRWWEALQPVLSFSPLPVLLLLAALAPRLPWGGGREPASPTNALVQESE